LSEKTLKSRACWREMRHRRNISRHALQTRASEVIPLSLCPLDRLTACPRKLIALRHKIN
jgi:hypothetical protein